MSDAHMRANAAADVVMLLRRALAAAAIAAEQGGYYDESLEEDGATVHEIVKQAQKAAAEYFGDMPNE